MTAKLIVMPTRPASPKPVAMTVAPDPAKSDSVRLPLMTGAQLAERRAGELGRRKKNRTPWWRRWGLWIWRTILRQK